MVGEVNDHISLDGRARYLLRRHQFVEEGWQQRASSRVPLFPQVGSPQNLPWLMY